MLNFKNVTLAAMLLASAPMVSFAAGGQATQAATTSGSLLLKQMRDQGIVTSIAVTSAVNAMSAEAIKLASSVLKDKNLSSELAKMNGEMKAKVAAFITKQALANDKGAFMHSPDVEKSAELVVEYAKKGGIDKAIRIYDVFLADITANPNGRITTAKDGKSVKMTARQMFIAAEKTVLGDNELVKAAEKNDCLDGGKI